MLWDYVLLRSALPCTYVFPYYINSFPTALQCSDITGHDSLVRVEGIHMSTHPDATDVYKEPPMMFGEVVK